MGNPKQRWTAEEEEALKKGISKHGMGKWKVIQKDPEFNHLLFSRSNIDLKDKWRNMGVASGQIPRGDLKSRVSKPKANPDAPATPLLIGQAPDSTDLVMFDTPSDAVMDDSHGKTASKYDSLIYEALSTMQDPNGSDIGSVVNFIGQRNEPPPNFRRLLTGRLRRLIGQGKLEKTQNGYKIPDIVIPEERIPVENTPIPKQKEIIQPHPRQPEYIGSYLGDSEKEAATYASLKIAEAENKSFVAVEAVKEAERVDRMAEDADALLEWAKHLYERCCQGEIVTIA